jgi:hypothetical protein
MEREKQQQIPKLASPTGKGGTGGTGTMTMNDVLAELDAMHQSVRQKDEDLKLAGQIGVLWNFFWFLFIMIEICFFFLFRNGVVGAQRRGEQSDC